MAVRGHARLSSEDTDEFFVELCLQAIASGKVSVDDEPNLTGLPVKAFKEAVRRSRLEPSKTTLTLAEIADELELDKTCSNCGQPRTPGEVCENCSRK